MKFKFPLQKVLDHRKTLENMAQRDFQEAYNKLTQMEQHLSDLQAVLHRAHLQAYQFQSEGGAQVGSLVQVAEFMRGQAILIERHKLAIQKQSEAVEAKRDLLRQAAVDTKIIAKLKERRLEEFKRESDLEEQREADEQSVLRYRSGSRE